MFGRKAPATDGPRMQAAYPALAPVAPLGVSAAGIGGTAGWRPLPGQQNPSQQIGMYAGSLLNQFPAYLPGVQRSSGVEFLSSRWYYPTTGPVALGGLTQTTRPNNIAGGQRYGSHFSGPIGPISAQANAAAVVAAQVKQSGLAALNWAKRLNPAYNTVAGS